MKKVCLSWPLVSSSACFSLPRSHASYLLSVFSSWNMSLFYPELQPPPSLLTHLLNLQLIKPWDSSFFSCFDWTETMTAFSISVCLCVCTPTIKHKYTEPFLTCHRIQSLFPWQSCFQFDLFVTLQKNLLCVFCWFCWAHYAWRQSVQIMFSAEWCLLNRLHNCPSLWLLFILWVGHCGTVHFLRIIWKFENIWRIKTNAQFTMLSIVKGKYL